jgi:hypothetical protein
MESMMKSGVSTSKGWGFMGAHSIPGGFFVNDVTEMNKKDRVGI